MLINISGTKLFKKEDKNVCVSCVEKDPAKCSQDFLKNTWHSAIRNLLGSDILNDTEPFIVRVHNRHSELLTTCLGCEIIDLITKYFSPSSIRIDLSKDEEIKSFVVLLKNDLI